MELIGNEFFKKLNYYGFNLYFNIIYMIVFFLILLVRIKMFVLK